MERIDNYLQVLYLSEQAELIQEGLGDIIKKLTMDKVKSISNTITGYAKKRDIASIAKATSSLGLHKVKPASLDSFAQKQSPDYAGVKVYARKILKNSIPKLKGKSLEAGASYVAIRSMIPDRKGEVIKSHKAKAKRVIKEFVAKTMKYYDDYEDDADTAEKQGKAPPIPRDSIPDYAIALAIIFGGIAIMGSIVYLTYLIINYLFWIVGILIVLSIAAGIVIAIVGTGKLPIPGGGT